MICSGPGQTALPARTRAEPFISDGYLSVDSTDRPAYVTAAKKHAEFVRARGRHYSNEAEAMKVRALYRPPLRWRAMVRSRLRLADVGDRCPQMAKRLMEEDDESSSVAESAEHTDTASVDEDSAMDEDEVHQVNGIAH